MHGQGGRRTINVLIIEDDLDDAYLIRRALMRAASQLQFNLNVSHYRNGWDALRAVAVNDLHGELPDLVIVDLVMPVMDGCRFLRKLRRDLNLPDLPAFVLTTTDPMMDVVGGHGADRLFVKPDSPEGYYGVARTMLQALPGPGLPKTAEARIA